MIYGIKRNWYSESKVSEILTPDLTTWRSRYDLKDQLRLTTGELVVRNLRQNDIVPKLSSNDMEHEVEPKEAFRPDIIAYNAYGDPRLAWVILSANGLNDIFDLEAHMRIIIPSSASLYMAGGVMSK